MSTALVARPLAGRSQGRRAPSRRLLVLGVCTLLAVLAGVVALFTPVLGVRTVQVQGARTVSVPQILETADVAPGTPLLRLDTGAIRARVAAIPAVASVRVSTTLPSSVTITITERTPVAYRVEGAYFRILDGAGVGFRLQAVRPKTVPLVDGAAGTATATAELAVAHSLAPAVLTTIASIAAPSLQSMTLTLTDGRVVLWGSTDRDPDKARLLQALIAQPGGYFDLSDPDFVVSRPTR